MENNINYNDVQRSILINYAEFGYIKARYLFIEIRKSESGRKLVLDLLPFITPAALNPKTKQVDLPPIATNIAFTYNGLKNLGLPALSLQSFPDEYIIGMRNRSKILGDDGMNSPEYWDKVYRDDIHIFVSIDAKNQEDLESRYNAIYEIISQNDGVILLDGCRAANDSYLQYQEAAALEINGVPTAKEHFGYTDGISNPFFKGMTPEMGSLLGGGKKVAYGDPSSTSNWAPVETGEFIMGYKDEANEYPVAAVPQMLSKNGTFLVFSKFHENVGKFNDYLDASVTKYGIGKEELAAKFVGRWRNGVPITTYPDKDDAEKLGRQREEAILAMSLAKTEQEIEASRKLFMDVNTKFIAFDYDNDLEGSKCPIGAHTRRVNPRGSLEFGNKNAFETPAALDNRRRMIRRGLPYGVSTPDSNTGEHGTIVMTLVASIKRQFEFVFQQWINYSNDFKLSNEKDPLLGNHLDDRGRMVVQGDKSKCPVFLSDMPRFIEVRGGVYLFMPSITALNLIGNGEVDPT